MGGERSLRNQWWRERGTKWFDALLANTARPSVIGYALLALALALAIIPPFVTTAFALAVALVAHRFGEAAALRDSRREILEVAEAWSHLLDDPRRTKSDPPPDDDPGAALAKLKPTGPRGGRPNGSTELANNVSDDNWDGSASNRRREPDALHVGGLGLRLCGRLPSPGC
jgi:hypothetical protein